MHKQPNFKQMKPAPKHQPAPTTKPQDKTSRLDALFTVPQSFTVSSVWDNLDGFSSEWDKPLDLSLWDNIEL